MINTTGKVIMWLLFPESKYMQMAATQHKDFHVVDLDVAEETSSEENTSRSLLLSKPGSVHLYIPDDVNQNVRKAWLNRHCQQTKCDFHQLALKLFLTLLFLFHLAALMGNCYLFSTLPIFVHVNARHDFLMVGYMILCLQITIVITLGGFLKNMLSYKL